MTPSKKVLINIQNNDNEYFMVFRQILCQMQIIIQQELEKE